MEGDPARQRDDPHEIADADIEAYAPRSRRPSYTLPITVLSIVAGIAAAITAIARSGVLADTSAGFGGTWPVSATAIAFVAGCWVAGFIYLVLFLLHGRSTRASHRSGLPATLAAFAAGPLLVALFFLGTELTRFPVSSYVAFPVAAAILILLLFARRRVRLLAERLLLSFFLWLAVLVAPTFWRDPVNDQMSSFLFRLLKTAGLLT